MDTGDGDDRVDIFLLCRELEFDGSRRDDFGNDKRTSPFVVQLLHGGSWKSSSGDLARLYP